MISSKKKPRHRTTFRALFPRLCRTLVINMTLNREILSYFLPGVRIISDVWRGYGQVITLPHGIYYMHDAVIGQGNFVSLNDDEIHTQNLDAMWDHVKCQSTYGETGH